MAKKKRTHHGGFCCPKNAEPAMHSPRTGKRFRSASCVLKKSGKKVARLKHCRKGQRAVTTAGTLWKAGPSTSRVTTHRMRSVGNLGCGCGG